MSSSSFKRSDGVNKSTTIDVGAVWSSIQLPRKGAPMRGNYDHLGDAYTRNHVEAARWEISDSKKYPYLAHIKSLAPTWKTLRYLSDWMEVGTTPLRWTERDREHDLHRIDRTTVTFLEFHSSDNHSVRQIRSLPDFKQTLTSLSHAPGSKPPMRLFIVEDLSREVIEALGSRFDIDPMCFREQIDDYVWHNVRDPWAQPPSLMASTKHRNWFMLRNMRLRYHETRDDFNAAWKETNTWNVLRRPDDDENEESGAGDEAESVVSILRTRTVVWIGKDKQCNDATVGIILADPTTTHGHPLWYDRSNFLPLPSMHAPPPTSPPPKSWSKDIANLTRTYPWFPSPTTTTTTTTTTTSTPSPHLLTKPLLFLLSSEWLLLIAYVKTRLSQIETGIQRPKLYYLKNDISRKRLHMWRKQVPLFREMVTETLEHALPAAARLTNSWQPKAANSPMDRKAIVTDLSFDDVAGYEDIIPDFKRILAAINDLQDRVDRLTDIVTAEISIEDTKRSLIETHNSARLTWLATIFVPLSLISSLYSMTEDISTLKETTQWYFVTAIPTTAVVMGIVWLIQRMNSGPDPAREKVRMKMKGGSGRAWGNGSEG